ncbi:MarR family winged helix-turn-helix transcriptional regulator [Aureimonas sp. AU12]|uniref:MarR family winged helix-turn-helix transcriptional regulator n=1 Tax=Aureimonas sp. AU12 TaxID=1638161 RepID=UPI00078418DD|nr:MarR family winged helix-turn-helix transcriptional regulator [Aureimonas sp. AU12]
MPHGSAEIANARALKAEDIDLDILDRTLNFFVRTINIAVTRDLDRRLEGLDVARGTGKITTLFLVGNHPGIRPSVIAEVILKDRSAMGRVLDDMEGHGLIRREVAGDDSRAQALFLTVKGEALAITVRAILKESRDFFAGTDDEEYAMLVEHLRRIYWRIVANKGASA